MKRPTKPAWCYALRAVVLGVYGLLIVIDGSVATAVGIPLLLATVLVFVSDELVERAHARARARRALRGAP